MSEGIRSNWRQEWGEYFSKHKISKLILHFPHIYNKKSDIGQSWWVRRKEYFWLTWPQQIMLNFFAFPQLTSLPSGTEAPNSLLLILSIIYVFKFLLSEFIYKQCMDIHSWFTLWSIISGLEYNETEKSSSHSIGLLHSLPLWKFSKADIISRYIYIREHLFFKGNVYYHNGV